MKSISLLTVLFFSANDQPTEKDFIATGRKVVDAINSDHPNAIWWMYANSLQTPTSGTDTADFVHRIANLRGMITKIGPPAIRDQNIAIFALEAERGPWEMTISLNNIGKITELTIAYPNSFVPKSNKTPMDLPFQGEWYVDSGGLTEDVNHHMKLSPNNRFGTDFTIRDVQGRNHIGAGTTNEEYYSYGKPIIAAAPGKVVTIVDGYPDNPPGTPDEDNGGNTVIIQHSEFEFTTYLHLMPGSIAVKVGASVVAGQILGKCGNSGRSDIPHIHFHACNRSLPQLANGFPVHFRRLSKSRDGKISEEVNYMPLKGDSVSNMRSNK